MDNGVDLDNFLRLEVDCKNNYFLLLYRVCLVLN